MASQLRITYTTRNHHHRNRSPFTVVYYCDKMKFVDDTCYMYVTQSGRGLWKPSNMIKTKDIIEVTVLEETGGGF